MSECGSWAGLRARAEQLETPLIVHLELTSACPWSCVFCATVPTPRHKALRASEWISVLDDLREMGALQVVFTGGEPLSSPDFIEVARAARARCFAIRVFSNLALLDEPTASAIAELRPLAVEASLHGATAATHDLTTQRTGSFDQVWSGVERLQRRGVRLALKTPVTRLNENEIEDLIDLARDRGVPLRLDLALSPRGDCGHLPENLEASEHTLRWVLARMRSLDQLPAAKHDGAGRSCGAGRTTLAIDPTGEVFPCVQWRSQSLGNVQTERLKEMWRRSRTRQTVSQITETAVRLLAATSSATAAYPYCAGVAEQFTGDPLKPDAGFLRRAHMAAEIREGP